MGGVAALNNGTIRSCNMQIKGMTSNNQNPYYSYIGGISGINNSIISSCSFVSEDGCDSIAGVNNGTII